MIADIIKIPFRILGFLIKHPRLLVAGLIIVFIVFGLSSCSSALGGKKAGAQETPAYQKIAPGLQEAPYVLLTDTRVYYVAKYENTQDLINLTEYWSYDRKAWAKGKHPLPISRDYFKGARLYDRANNKILVSF